MCFNKIEPKAEEHCPGVIAKQPPKQHVPNEVRDQIKKRDNFFSHRWPSWKSVAKRAHVCFAVSGDRNKKVGACLQHVTHVLQDQFQAQGGIFDDFSNLGQNVKNITDTIENVKRVMSLMRGAIQFPGSDSLADDLISRLENLVLMMISLSRTQKAADMVPIVMLYMKTVMGSKSFSKSIWKMVNRVIRELMEVDTQRQAQSNWEPIDPNGFESQAGFFEANWRELTTGMFGTKFASLLNVLILAGMVPEKDNNHLTEEVFKVLNVHNQRKKHPSIFHHLFATLDWVAECVIPAFSTGNYALLISEADVVEIDEQYRKCLKVVHLASLGQMDLVTKEFGIPDEAGILMLLVNVSLSLSSLKNRFKNDPFAQKEYQSRLIKLDKLSGDLQAQWKESSLRTKPYAVFIRGGTSVGKSVLANAIQHWICEVNGFSQAKEHWVVLNGSDQYQSDFKTQHTCVQMDDVCNTRAEKCVGNPLFILIQFINNVHCAALSPIAENKGKMDIRCKVVVVTSNTKDLNAGLFSVNPASIMRRFDLVVDVKVKEECKDETGSLHERYSDNSMPDAWHIKAGRVKITRLDEMSDLWNIEQIPSVKDIVTLGNYIATTTPAYYDKQDRIVAAATELHKKPHCPKHKIFCLPCAQCAREEKANMEGVDGEECRRVAEEVLAKCDARDEAKIQIRDILQKAVEKQNSPSEVELEDQAGFVGDNDPQFFAEMMNFAMELPMPSGSDNIFYDAESAEEADFVCVLPPSDRIKKIVSEGVNDILSHVLKLKHNVEKSPWAIALATVGALGLTAFAIHKLLEPEQWDQQGAAYSRLLETCQTPRQIVERDNVYQRVHADVSKYPATKAGTSATLNQVEVTVNKNLHIAYVTELNNPNAEKQYCSVFPYENGSWLFPNHLIEDGKMYHLEIRRFPTNGMKRFEAVVHGCDAKRVANKDLCSLRLPSGGSCYAFSKFILDEEAVVEPGDTVYLYHADLEKMRNIDKYEEPSQYKRAVKVIETKLIQTKQGPVRVFTYATPTFKGLCGAMIFTGSKNPQLIGMHVAGNPKTDVGAAVFLSNNDIRAAMDYPKEVINICADTNPRDEILKVDVGTKPEAHTLNPVHTLVSNHNFHVYGETNLPKSRFKTEIRPSIFSLKLKEIAGLEPKHGAPRRDAVRPTRLRHIDNVTKILPSPDQKFVDYAVKDFKAKLEQTIFKEGSLFAEKIHPITYEDALNGVPGVHGYDCINPNTGISFPLSGPKHKFFKKNDELYDSVGISHKYVNKIDLGDGKVRYEYTLEFDPEKANIRDEVDHYLESFVNGESVKVVFRTNIKDEPVTWKKIEDNKLRIFAGAPVSLVIVSRILTLTLLNAMSHFPKEFESAVGIDAAGKDWEYLANYLKSKSGGTRCGDGDFSAYDQKLRPEFTLAAFEIIKWLLLKSGASDDVLKALDGVATECCFPVYEIEALLIQTFGSGPSGHPLTVIINGLANALYMRYAYYSMHYSASGKVFTQIPLFHERVALITYGDDNDWDASSEEELFNMQSIAEELSKIGLSYTDATKKVSLVPYKPLEECSFLKRSFHYHEELGAIVGALEIDSINKSLLLSRKPAKGLPYPVAQIGAQVLSSALKEAYLHGPEVYDQYYGWFEQLRNVIDEQGHKVSHFYSPPSKADLKRAFDKTFCCYDEAQKLLEGIEINLPKSVDDDMEQQSGVVSEARQSIRMSLLGMFQAEYPEELDSTHESMEWNHVTYANIKFKMWMYEDRNGHNFALDGPDYRLDAEFRQELVDVKYERRLVYVHHGRAMEIIEHLANRDEGSMCVIGHKHLRIFQLFRRKRLREINLPLADDIVGIVFEYLRPDLRPAAMTNLGVVFATEDLSHDPVSLITRLAQVAAPPLLEI